MKVFVETQMRKLYLRLVSTFKKDIRSNLLQKCTKNGNRNDTNQKLLESAIYIRIVQFSHDIIAFSR